MGMEMTDAHHEPKQMALSEEGVSIAFIRIMLGTVEGMLIHMCIVEDWLALP